MPLIVKFMVCSSKENANVISFKTFENIPFKISNICKIDADHTVTFVNKYASNLSKKMTPSNIVSWSQKTFRMSLTVGYKF